ncbi:SiaB family protein kinase [Paenibacillus thermotolerans]|uniref:SiaB family protein kinase n=1 Tax=Paenibacillus thermotolerans TaxID=3027807 RepID=UPI00236793B3|nr:MULTISPECIES: SiaB family protein kinase [unclassified Paenibacillus]
MVHEMLELQRSLRERGLLISFSGRFSQEIIEELGEALKKYLETEEHPKTDIFNIFSIFIEQTQNIKNYCQSKQGTEIYDNVANSCIVTIGKTEEGSYICCGNNVSNADIEPLVRILEMINGMDKAELKKLYKAKLKEETPPERSGAGIGLIDIARKAKQPLEFDITKVDEQLSFFTLKAVV